MINIVMVARDRNRLTHQAIDSLITHTGKGKFNLVLVDDCSFEPQPKFGWPTLSLNTSRHNLGALKNLGVYWSEHHFGRGEYLYLSDNDVFFRQHWLETLLTGLALCEDRKLLLIGGQNHPYHQSVGTLEGVNNGSVQEYHALAGTSWLMRWETWDKYGPLPETGAPGVGQSEDHEFCQRIRRDGFKVGAVWPHVVLDTGIRQTDGNLSPGHEAKQKVAGIYYET